MRADTDCDYLLSSPMPVRVRHASNLRIGIGMRDAHLRVEWVKPNFLEASTYEEPADRNER